MGAGRRRRVNPLSAQRLLFHKPGGVTPPPPDPMPTDVPGGLLWFDGNTYTGSGAGLSWTERFFGVHNAVVVGTAPVPAPSADFNNHTVFPFLAASPGRMDFGVGSSFINKDSEYHLIVVAKMRSAAPASTFYVYLVLQTNLSVGNNWFAAWFAANFAGYKNFSVGGGDAFFDTSCGNDAFDYTVPWIMQDRYDGTGSLTTGTKHNMTGNGASIPLTDSAGAVNTNDLLNSIGAYGTNGLPADIDVAEILLYDHILTTDEENTINGYLFNKFQFGPMPVSFRKAAAAPKPLFGTWRTGMTTPPQQIRWGKIAAVAASVIAAAGAGLLVFAF